MLFILQIIALSASANKLSKIQDRAEEYAALIIEELDPDNLGYIEVYILSNYFLNFIFTPIFVKNKRGSNVNIILLKLDTKKNELKCQIWKLRIYSFCCTTIVNTVLRKPNEMSPRPPLKLTLIGTYLNP